MSKAIAIPWCDCKIAFPVTCSEDVWEAEAAFNLPDGWELIETDDAGARSVAVFRVSGMPTISEGLIVKKILKRAGALVGD